MKLRKSLKPKRWRKFLKLRMKRLKRSLKRKRNLASGIGIRIRMSLLKKLKKLRMKRLKRSLKRKRNPTSGAGTRTRMKMQKMFLPTARQKEEYSHLYVKKPFRKNTLKTFCLNLKWNSCRVTLQWRSQQRLWKTSRKTL